ncbi:acyl-CoA hydrolase [Thermus arciformis]|uniref:Acyl-CoA hydrolase n=1 Tax=Thermus arciformis TaxID=482827 RepID=A0A1G7FVR2_9DEIN|nr:hotdog domain-containing protein [Thermus arciformis]SDE79967.1 acyl-CoA hydrolase [Thermus arciformis]
MEARTLELVFPEHTNPLGAAFGGFVLGLMDKVGSYAAARRAKKPVVTVAVGSVEFKVPIRTGDLLEVVARVVRVGRTSLTVEVEVYKERFGEENGRVLATKGTLTYVAVNEKGEPVPVEAHAGAD